jgi:hypothetical protein
MGIGSTVTIWLILVMYVKHLKTSIVYISIFVSLCSPTYLVAVVIQQVSLLSAVFMEFSPEPVCHIWFQRTQVLIMFFTAIVVGVSGLVSLAKSPNEIGWAMLSFSAWTFNLFSLTEPAWESPTRLWVSDASYQGLYRVPYYHPSFCGWDRLLSLGWVR